MLFFKNKTIHFILVNTYVLLLLALAFYSKEIHTYLYAQEWTPQTIKYLALSIMNGAEPSTQEQVSKIILISVIYLVLSLPLIPQKTIDYIKLKINKENA